MKNLVIAVAFLLVPVFCFSQGIKFEQGSWTEVLALAKKTNKPIFVDIYTTWCGPCKKMSQEVFPLEEVGRVYNANFVCCQIDAEKGEGIELAKKYNVTAYPTYLFIKADGTLFYRSLGSMPYANFIEESQKALVECKDPMSITDWEAAYLQKKNNPQFLLDYMNKRTRLELPNTALFNEYLQLIPEAERTSEQVMTLYQKEGENLTVNDFAFQYLLKNKAVFLKDATLSVYAILYLQSGINKTVKEATQLKNEALLESAIAAFDQVPEFSASKSKEEFYMEYYLGTNDTDKYVKYTTQFCNNKLMTVSPDSILKKDSLNAQLLKAQLDSLASTPNASLDLSKINSNQLAQLIDQIGHMERDRVCSALNKNAWYFFEHISDVNGLQDALRWSERSVQLVPNKSTFIDTYANLLYKLGRKEEAIAKEMEAMRYSSINEASNYVEAIRKMESGEKTWK
jgi:thiol-disulfide isomerase/thioredoxin